MTKLNLSGIIKDLEKILTELKKQSVVPTEPMPKVVQPSTKNLLTVYEIAGLLDTDKSYVYHLIRKDRLPGPITKIGKKSYWNKKETTIAIKLYLKNRVR